VFGEVPGVRNMFGGKIVGWYTPGCNVTENFRAPGGEVLGLVGTTWPDKVFCGGIDDTFGDTSGICR
jgi:hypothetical protein